ncbi:MAG: hypothetical protein LIP77_07340, partial [Planctomycetes bacterium]|nr:hypothetical protein [Planctomycetota bacterium]
GARLPIYSLLIPAFFAGAFLRASILWSLYILGILFAVVGAKVLRSTLFKGESVPFVMELPPYRMPTLRSVVLLMWERAREYIRKAGTIILGVSIILWAMTNYPKKETFDRDYDAARETAAYEYQEAVRSFARTALPDVPDELVDGWLEADQELAEASDEFWETDPAYKAAEEVHAQTLAGLFQATGGGDLERLVEAVAAVDEIEAALAEAVEDEADETSPEYRTALAERDAALADLGLPDDLMESVAEFREEIRQPYQEQIEALDHEEEGEQLAYSISGRVGQFLEPALRPLGFDWRIGTAIIGSFAAKEVFVAQMGIVFAVGEADEDSDSLRETLRENYTPLQAFCMMIWALLSLPCVATIAVARRETGGWRYAIGMMIGLTIIAYVTTLIVYQVGSALGIGM